MSHSAAALYVPLVNLDTPSSRIGLMPIQGPTDFIDEKFEGCFYGLELSVYRFL